MKVLQVVNTILLVLILAVLVLVWLREPMSEAGRYQNFIEVGSGFGVLDTSTGCIYILATPKGGKVHVVTDIVSGEITDLITGKVVSEGAGSSGLGSDGASDE